MCPECCMLLEEARMWSIVGTDSISFCNPSGACYPWSIANVPYGTLYDLYSRKHMDSAVPISLVKNTTSNPLLGPTLGRAKQGR